MGVSRPWRIVMGLLVLTGGLLIFHVGPPLFDGIGEGFRTAGIVLLGLVGIAVVIIAIHQYRAWAPYRPAIHIGIVLVVFVGGVSWWLGPQTDSDPGLSGQESLGIRIAAAGLLVFLVLSLGYYLETMEN